MFKTIQNAWKIPDLRKKLLYTLLIIVVFRIGASIPVPFLNMDALAGAMGLIDESGNLLSYINTLSGGAFANATLFAMSVTPYINSSIIMQLLTVAIRPLERMAKEGEEGRKKIAAITRYVTVILGLIQGTAYYFYLRNTTFDGANIMMYNEGASQIFSAIVIVLVFTAGTAMMMWLGEQINRKGIGNGISILLFAGIVARLPDTIQRLGQYWNLAALGGDTKYFFGVPLFVLLFLVVIWVIVFMHDAERRIPVQYAKRVVGRKMYGGQSSHIPIKVNLSGVMPIIFASSILAIPSTINMFVNPAEGSFWKGFLDAFSNGGWIYSILYFLLIIMFAYFYVTIQYNPVEMANNLRQNNGTIPGIRPGKPTSDFISKILSKITLIGALFLAFIAIIPIVFGAAAGMQGVQMGGTSIIILVGVALETVKQMESQMMMRHYKGFLD